MERGMWWGGTERVFQGFFFLKRSGVGSSLLAWLILVYGRIERK